ncbi:MAG: mandelate racemase/muconate lactonizing enzyme family protein, partial [Dehalococcoidia bacterium]|nr:mandelate racemase/muconate lactonizing enzyme family protein [Dehalococcoidia bacterium]
MKITAIENFAVRGLGRNPWLFCAIRTDEGITGYSEYGEGALTRGLPGLVEDLGESLIGQDPLPVDKLYMDMYRRTRSASGGATAMAIAGIELALWDIKGKFH